MEKRQMATLTGEQRIHVIVAWIKKGGKTYMDKETFVKKVCLAKDIEYVAPTKVDR